MNLDLDLDLKLELGFGLDFELGLLGIDLVGMGVTLEGKGSKGEQTSFDRGRQVLDGELDKR